MLHKAQEIGFFWGKNKKIKGNVVWNWTWNKKLEIFSNKRKYAKRKTFSMIQSSLEGFIRFPLIEILLRFSNGENSLRTLPFFMDRLVCYLKNKFLKNSIRKLFLSFAEGIFHVFLLHLLHLKTQLVWVYSTHHIFANCNSKVMEKLWSLLIYIQSNIDAHTDECTLCKILWLHVEILIEWKSTTLNTLIIIYLHELFCYPGYCRTRTLPNNYNRVLQRVS